MALPTTISGISTAVACVGPFKTTDACDLGIVSGLASVLDSAYTMGTAAFEKRGQAFTTVGALTVTNIKLKLQKSGSPVDNVSADIFATDGSGLPTGSTLGTSTNTIVGSTLADVGSGVYTDSTFNFSSVSLSAATKYCVVLSRTGSVDASHFFAFAGSSAAPYSGGTALTYNGSAWSTATADFYIAVNAGQTAFYFIGRSSSASSRLRAMKATDPTSSFSQAGTDPQLNGGSDPIAIAAYQVGDVIHVVSNVGGVQLQVAYATFDLGTDVWGTTETVHSGVNAQTSANVDAPGVSVVVRSDTTVVILYNGPRVASMGTSYSRIVYARRASAGGWTTNIAVDAGGTINCVDPEAVIGASDRVHFFWHDSGQNHLRDRTLVLSGNALQTASSSTANINAIDGNLGSGISYDDGGTIRLVLTGGSQTSNRMLTVREDSDDVLTILSLATVTTGVANPCRMFNDGTDVWALYRSSTASDLYVIKSTDDGASFSGEALALTGTVANVSADLSKDGNIYLRGNDYVIPYVVNDNGTLKYNEYVVRSVAAAVETNTFTQGRFTAKSPHRLTPALRHNIAADFSVAQTQPSTPVHFIGKFKPYKFVQQKGLWLSSAADVPPVVQPATNIHFLGRFKPSRFDLLSQLRQHPAQDTSAAQTQPETNTHFIGRFKPNRFSLLYALKYHEAQDISVFEPSTPPHFAGRFTPTRFQLNVDLKYHEAQDESARTAETNTHFVGRFTPYRLNLTISLRHNIAADDTSQAPFETNPHFLGRFTPSRLQSLQLLRQNIAADYTSTVAFETNTHFIGRFKADRFQLNNGLWIREAQDGVQRDAETNTFQLARYKPYSLQLQIALRQNVAADDSGPVTQPETNTHFIGRFSPTTIKALPLLHRAVPQDTSFREPDVTPHFIGRFKPTNFKLQPELNRTIAADFTTAQTQAETNTHFLGKFQPTRIRLSAVPRQAVPQDNSFRETEPNPHFLGRFKPTAFRLRPELSRTIAADFTATQTQAETNTHFVGRFRQPRIAKLALLWQNEGIRFVSNVEAGPNFAGRFTPSTIRQMLSLRQNIAADYSTAQVQPSTPEAMSRYVTCRFKATKLNTLRSLHQVVASDDSYTPSVTTTFDNNPMIASMGRLMGR